MSSCVVEVQGCSWKSTYFAKEICVYNNNNFYTFLVKQEKPYRSFRPEQRKIINWTFKKYHGIPWESGKHTLEQLKPLLKQIIGDKNIIFTKGQSKALFLKNLLNIEVIDLSKIKCPSVSKREYKTNCLLHKAANAYCAADSAHLLINFINGHAEFKKCFEKVE